MHINAWIISLNPQSDVVQSLLATLREQQIEAAIFPAVDGRKAMPVLQGDEKLDQARALVNRKAPLTSSEVGCYLSHYRLIRHAWEQGLSHVCIFEDDVVAEPGLGDLLRSIVTLDDDADLVRLMSLKIRKRKVVQPLAAGYTLVRPVRGALGTQGYVLNRSGMRKILEFGADISMPIDKLYDSFFLFDLHCFSVEPHAIYELANPSTVVKTGGNLDRRLWIALQWHLNKLHRSLRRKLHYLANRDAFSPATKPKGSQGKSKRIR